MPNDFWVFGYGSILWKVDFPFAERSTAHIKGWSRRFYQGSVDHRGIPGSPGRVVTLIDSPKEICWGIAYRLSNDGIEDTLAALDYRERGGYDRLEIDLHLETGESVNGITYFASGDNPNYLGHAETSDIAQQIFGASGPSGDNTEYVFRLEQTLGEIGSPDDHVTDIANQLRQLKN
tara:strand:+ start:301 stop:831 length:531 start_codon:yes stop_codon:yes gene_type:complete